MPINIKRSNPGILVSTILILFILSAPVHGQASQNSEGIRTVVIDAGHGGKDSGAVGKKGKEKNIALSIALKVGNYIEENLEDVEVIYTRKKDVYVELWKRAEIANKAEADLFLSIHVNAFTKSYANGTLTLVLGQHRAGENFNVAVRENSVILLEEDYETRYEGFDPRSTESYIMFSLMQKTYFKQSIEFGDFIQDQFRERAQRNDLGVREQGVYVLAQTAMPAVMVETGFITNPEEEKYLMTDYGQDIIASAIYRGFKEYKEEIDRKSNMTVALDEPIKENLLEDVEEEFEALEGKLYFYIQVASSRSEKAVSDPGFKNHGDIKVLRDGKWYKYLAGRETTYKDALNKCQLLKKDFPDAFVVAVRNEKLLPLKEALEEINN